MQLKIENVQVAKCINVLDKLVLKGLKSIHRTRLSKELGEKLERIGKEEREIQKEHCKVDEDGELIVTDGKLDVVNIEQYKKDINAFYSEEVVIDGGDSQVALKSVRKSLEVSEVDWVGAEAYTFEYLYSALENGSDEKDEDTNDGGED